MYWEVRSWIFPLPQVLLLWLRNRYGRAPLIDAEGAVVSLTSYGKRIDTVYLTIESIGQGTLRPSKVILWLDDQVAFEHPPETIRRLVQRGLEVRLCANYGPHKKYYPYVQAFQQYDLLLVTADDDVFYPRDWLQSLVGAYRQFPDVINCHRARVVTIREGRPEAYGKWKFAADTAARNDRIATGVGGVLYPPAFLRVLKNAGDGFIDLCPRADDLWVHVHAIRAGYKVRQIRSAPLSVLSIPGAESVGLWKTNLSGDNDIQIALTYTTRDIQELLCRED